jgi:uncharacterized membrane protein YgcG
MHKRFLCHLTLAALIAAGPTVAQQPAPAAASPPAPSADAAGEKTFSQQDLDRLVAPIALYPDSLLAQILMASTYPLDIVTAARWAKANPGVKDKALEDAMQKQTWDPAVKALTSVPKVLEQMNEQIEWTQQLGDAFLAQQADVMTTVQALRKKAAAAGNLKSTPEVAVKTEQAEGKTVYVIESAKPEVVYVPTYNPATVYGAWAYPAYPPYSMYPPYYPYAPGVAFATGVIVGAAIWGNANWGGNNVNINTNNYNNFNKTNVQNKNFQHNAENRKGVAYKDKGVAAQNNRGASAQNSQARAQHTGRSDQGRGGGQQGASNFGGGDRGASASQSAAGSRGDFSGGGGSRGDSGSRGGSSPSASSRGSGGGGGFSGAGSGASTRAASSRGGASRGGGGGGRGGGGRR